MNVRAEFELVAIQHIAVQCDQCGNWFNGVDVTEDELDYEYDIYHASFKCPICGRSFGADVFKENAGINIQECSSSEEVYKDCKQRKAVWE